MIPPTPIVPLDVATPEDALELVDYLDERCRFYKVGSQLFTAVGPAIVRELRARGCEVFLDLKFHDIPNTVAGGVASAAAMGARLVTVHAIGGRAMLEAAVKAAGDCRVLAVTALTSLTAAEVASAWGRVEGVDLTAEVLRLSALAQSAGVHGVVCSGWEARAVRERFGGRLDVLVPGVRDAASGRQDQSRVVTPRQAAEAGATYVIVGRIVTAASDRRSAMDRVLGELRSEAGAMRPVPTPPLA